MWFRQLTKRVGASLLETEAWWQELTKVRGDWAPASYRRKEQSDSYSLVGVLGPGHSPTGEPDHSPKCLICLSRFSRNSLGTGQVQFAGGRSSVFVSDRIGVSRQQEPLTNNYRILNPDRSPPAVRQNRYYHHPHIIGAESVIRLRP